jgi:hypothetical protein
MLRFIPLSTTALYNDCSEVARYTVVSFDDDPSYSKASYDQLRLSTQGGQQVIIDSIVDWCTPVGLGPSQARLYLF